MLPCSSSLPELPANKDCKKPQCQSAVLQVDEEILILKKSSSVII